MAGVLDWKCGWLTVKSETILDPVGPQLPMFSVLWYPFEKMTQWEAERDHPLGAALEYEGEGFYSYQIPDDPFKRKIHYRLAEGGETKPIFSEATPILPPKDEGKIIKTRKARQNIPIYAAPFERISYEWDPITRMWKKQTEFISQDEAERLGLGW